MQLHTILEKINLAITLYFLVLVFEGLLFKPVEFFIWFSKKTNCKNYI